MAERTTIYLDDAINLLEELETKRLQGDVGLLYAPMIKGLKALPPAQPEPCEDAVSRQDAIRIVDGIDTWQAGWRGDAIESMKALPSAQPDLVRCKDCEYGEQDEVGRWFCRSLGCQIGNEDGSGYCADAERRTDDR